jgi:integrase/recombinase XerD
MASLYRKPVIVTDPKTGCRVKTQSKKWWGRYRDSDGKEKRVPLAIDKVAALAMLNEIVRRTEREAAGLVDPYDAHRKRPIQEHLKAFESYLSNKGTTENYLKTTLQRARAVVAACKCERLDQLSAGRVQAYLAGLRKEGMSIGSNNHYLRAIKMFTRWLVRDRRSHDDPLQHLSKINVELDRRRVRRPLSGEEFALLLESTQNRPKKLMGLSGPDRVVLYLLGAYTGYRRNEIGSVTRHSFDFESDPPTLTVAAKHSKHRKVDVIPLRKDFAERIRIWIDARPRRKADKPLFPITGGRTAETIRKDLAAAREQWLKQATDDSDRRRREASSFLAYQDEAGRVVDFHSLRMTFITNLTRSGVAPKTAQLLARHSDINLTMNTYTMLGVLDQASAVESLPPIPLGAFKDSGETRHLFESRKRA